MSNPLDLVQSIIADDVASAAADARKALAHYRDVVGAATDLDHNPLVYSPSSALIDTLGYKLESVNSLRPFRHDHALVAAADAEEPFLEMFLLAASPHWEDRIRAQVLYLSLRSEITLPDGFPCIYEPVDSPHNKGVLRPRPFVWVASPDAEMLREALPLYRELWLSYESQWPHTPNRTFEFGYLSGVSTHSVFRPGAGVEDVIGSTLLTHTEMYARAPKHLQEMSYRVRAEKARREAAEKGSA